MLALIKRFHRSLLSYLLYPLLFSSALCLSLYIGRVYRSGSFAVYRNLVWNLVLAWAPYLFSLWAAWLHSKKRRAWWRILLPGSLWLLFFPNAPYLLTDFLHLQERPAVPLWYDILLLATFAWTGCFLAIASLRIMQGLVRSYAGRLFGWFFAAAAIVSSGVGVYLGRFSRWNSWDMFFQPKTILAEIAGMVVDPINNLRFVGFTLLFVLFLSVCYLTYVSMHHINDPETLETRDS